MATSGLLHSRLLDLSPKELHHPDKIVVGILKHDVSPESMLTSKDVLYMACTREESLTDVVHGYLIQHPTVQHIMLQHESKPRHPQTKLKDLLNSNKGFLALIARACELNLASNHFSVPVVSNKDASVNDGHESNAVGAGPAHEPSSFQLTTKFCDSLSVRQLARCSRKAFHILQEVYTIVQPESTPEVKKFSKDIKYLREKSWSPKAVIGVFGNMGAGKSALINALLEVEKLLPTSGSRACTATATEIAYCADRNWPYKAEIVFCSRKDWQQSLKALIEDLADENGKFSTTYNRETTLAGAAYAQLNTVYSDQDHNFWKRSITKINAAVEELLQHKKSQCLNKISFLQDETALGLHDKIAKYVDAQHRLWPLIKVVRVYARARILKTGAKIVDLPGLYDSNKTRASMAEAYLKQCTRLWIVAPIIRAVNEECARKLLDASMQLQIKMDGNLTRVTFICTKTDDITFSGALDSQVTTAIKACDGQLYGQLCGLFAAQKTVEDSIALLKTEHRQCNHEAILAHHRYQVYRQLLESARKGETVNEPTVQDLTLPPKKKKQRMDSACDGVKESTEPGIPVSSAAPSRGVLCEALIKERIESLAVTKQQFRKQLSAMNDELKQKQQRLSVDIRQEKERILEQYRVICVKERNNTSKAQIKADFCRGIEDLEDDLAEDSEATPEATLEATKALEVFCVSSKAYQILESRMDGDRLPKGFLTVADSEIPQLQDHCMSETDKVLKDGYRRFLTRCLEILHSLCRWTGAAQLRDSGVTNSELADEAEIRKDQRTKLCQNICNLAETAGDALAKALVGPVLMRALDDSVSKAKKKVPVIVSDWEKYKLRTYQAVCRRYGAFAKSRCGAIDFNHELAQPILRAIGTPWAKIFGKTIPDILGMFESQGKESLSAFHSRFKNRRLNAFASPELDHLQLQQENYVNAVAEIVRMALQRTHLQQMEISRMILPVVSEMMKKAYDDCNQSKGKGCYLEMKQLMQYHTEEKKIAKIYRKVKKDMKGALKKLSEDVKALVFSETQILAKRVGQDYSFSRIGRSESEQRALATPEYIGMRNKVETLLKTAEAEVILSTAPEIQDGESDPGDFFSELEKPACDDVEVFDDNDGPPVANDDDEEMKQLASWIKVEEPANLKDILRQQPKREHSSAFGGDNYDENSSDPDFFDIPDDDDEWIGGRSAV